MKKLISPVLAVLALTSLLMLTGCPKDPCEDQDCGLHGTCIEVDEKAFCQCDEGWEGTLCDKEIPDTTDVEDTRVRGSAGIVVQNYNWAADKWKTINNEGCLAVVGKTKESMYYLEYFYNETNKKFDLKNRAALLDDESVVYAAYSVKDAGTDPETDKAAGIISLDSIVVGTYYMHVFDPNGDKFVSEITITEGSQDMIIAKVQPLVSVKLILGITEVVGNELDSVPIQVFGSGNDTLTGVQIKDFDNLPYEPIYQGRTKEIANDRNIKESGAFYLWDIPRRGYTVMAFNSQYHTQYDKHAYLELSKMAKNSLNLYRICWRGCN